MLVCYLDDYDNTTRDCLIILQFSISEYLDFFKKQIFQAKKRKHHKERKLSESLNSKASILNIQSEKEEDKLASDDTLEEAPTITEEIAKESLKEKEEIEVCERSRMKKTNTMAIKSERGSKKHSKYTQFKALAHMGEEVFSKERQVREIRSENSHLSQSSSKEEIILPPYERLPKRSQAFDESIEDTQGKRVDQGISNQKKKISENRKCESSDHQEKL